MKIRISAQTARKEASQFARGFWVGVVVGAVSALLTAWAVLEPVLR